jgi:hypothetical protein
VERGAEITSRPKFGGREFGKGSMKYLVLIPNNLKMQKSRILSASAGPFSFPAINWVGLGCKFLTVNDDVYLNRAQPIPIFKTAAAIHSLKVSLVRNHKTARNNGRTCLVCQFCTK